MASTRGKRRTRRKAVERKVNYVKETIRNEVIGLAAIGLACLGVVSVYSEKAGFLGDKIKYGLTILSGGGRLWLLLILGLWGLAYMNRRQQNHWRAVGIVLLWTVLVAILHLQIPGVDNLSKSELISEGKLGHGGGLIGALVAVTLKGAVGIAGSYVILIIAALIGALLVTNWSLIEGFREARIASKNTGSWVTGQVKDFVSVLQDKSETDGDSSKPSSFTFTTEPSRTIIKDNVSNENSEHTGRHLVIQTFDDHIPELPRDISNNLSKGPQRHDVSEVEHEDDKKLSNSSILPPGKVTGTPISRQAKLENSSFDLPSLNILQKSLKVKNSRLNKDLADNVRILEETLNSFGVKIKVTHVTQGPAITRYEAQPAPGVKVSRIVNLADDIALSLAASDVRIEAPVPGKSVVGIEVPNPEIAMVHFREVLEGPEFQNASSKLSLALGKDITGAPIIADLARMPHLLIAGATGSGKSVCVNTIINSILFKSHPDEVKFLLVDPKMVELTNYNGIPHLIAPVVTDPKKAAGALKWIVTEMETRYELFASAGVRDIVRYNYLRSQEQDSEKPHLPFVVVIIDELADLMMVAPGDVEDSICRLAQMARAAGIHLIVATQRPSVDVITGLIKANIPSRIAFAVSSQTDSRTILDMNGAEKLLGRGDMLFYPMGSSKPIRVQGCFLTDKEVDGVVKFLSNQAKPEYQEIPNVELGELKVEEAEDELFYKAGELFVESGNASVSLLQRRLRIGYTRAARLMDILEEKGVVGGYEGSKPREVLLTRGQFEQKFGSFEKTNS